MVNLRPSCAAQADKRRPTALLSALLLILILQAPCLLAATTLGPLRNDADVQSAQQQLGVPSTVESRPTQLPIDYIVVSDKTGAQLARTLLAELRTSGVKDVVYVRTGDFGGRVSAGVYAGTGSAGRRVTQLDKKGFTFQTLPRTTREVSLAWITTNSPVTPQMRAAVESRLGYSVNLFDEATPDILEAKPAADMARQPAPETALKKVPAPAPEPVTKDPAAATQVSTVLPDAVEAAPDPGAAASEKEDDTPVATIAPRADSDAASAQPLSSESVSTRIKDAGPQLSPLISEPDEASAVISDSNRIEMLAPAPAESPGGAGAKASPQPASPSNRMLQLGILSTVIIISLGALLFMSRRRKPGAPADGTSELPPLQQAAALVNPERSRTVQPAAPAAVAAAGAGAGETVAETPLETAPSIEAGIPPAGTSDAIAEAQPKPAPAALSEAPDASPAAESRDRQSANTTLLDSIDTADRRAKDLIGDLVALAQIDRTANESFNLDAMLLGVVNDARTTHSFSTLRYRPTTVLPGVQANVEALRRLLGILITQAVSFDDAAHILISAAYIAKPSGQLAVSLVNEAALLTEEDMVRVRDTSSSMGARFSIAEQLAQKMSGHIGLSSRFGTGTRLDLRLTLPATESDASESSPVESGPDTTGTERGDRSDSGDTGTFTQRLADQHATLLATEFGKASRAPRPLGAEPLPGMTVATGDAVETFLSQLEQQLNDIETARANGDLATLTRIAKWTSRYASGAGMTHLAERMNLLHTSMTQGQELAALAQLTTLHMAVVLAHAEKQAAKRSETG